MYRNVQNQWPADKSCGPHTPKEAGTSLRFTNSNTDRQVKFIWYIPTSHKTTVLFLVLSGVSTCSA